MGLLRFFLAISVVIAHGGSIFGINLLGGQTSVQLFYIFSGFYMTLILNQKYIGRNSSFKLFITNRLLRLFPIYWFVLILTFLFSITIIFYTHGQNLNKLNVYFESSPTIFTLIYFISSQMFLIGLDLTSFLGFDINNGNLFFTNNFHLTNPEVPSFLFIPQAWTLSLEIYFYLIAPLILRKSKLFIFILMILSFLFRIYLYFNFNLKLDPWTYRFFPTELFFFLLGYFSFKLMNYFSNFNISYLAKKIIVFFSFFSIFIYEYIPDYKSFYSPFSYREIFIFIVISLSLPFLFLFFKNNELDNKIGELSFPIYIVHMSIIPFVNIFKFKHSSLIVVIITILSAYLLNRYIGKPIENYRKSRIL
jgi:peptidoglycan/LPS O-acetylase OafA/YrhL